MHATREHDDLGALLAHARSGDASAWDELVERFTGLLWSIARAHRLPPGDAADVVQTTWLRLVEHLDRIQEPERLGGWLATTARHECLHVLRRGGREAPSTVDDALGAVPDPRPPVDDALLVDERDALLWRLVDDLPDRCRRLLRVLMASPPPTYADVSAALDLPIGSIGPTRARCLSQLRAVAVAAGVSEDLRD